MNNRHKKSFRLSLRKVHNRLALLIVILACGFGAWQLHTHPETPLPDGWNLMRPLAISDAVTPLTFWKLERALATPEACLSALVTSADFAAMESRQDSSNCHIRNRVGLRQLGQIRLASVETSCAIALRTAMWVQHDLQPAAIRILGAGLEEIEHFGSYNCRTMRTGTQGEPAGARMQRPKRWMYRGFGLAEVSGFRSCEIGMGQAPRQIFAIRAK